MAPEAGLAKHDNGHYGSVQSDRFLNYVSNYQLICVLIASLMLRLPCMMIGEAS
jgi:hypothetical protein